MCFFTSFGARLVHLSVPEFNRDAHSVTFWPAPPQRGSHIGVGCMKTRRRRRQAGDCVSAVAQREPVFPKRPTKAWSNALGLTPGVFPPDNYEATSVINPPTV